MEWWLLDRECITFMHKTTGSGDERVDYEFMRLRFELQKKDRHADGMTRTDSDTQSRL